MKISYAMTTSNELDLISNINKIIDFITAPSEIEYELVVVDDESSDPKIVEFFESFTQSNIKIISRKFTGNFAEHKNFLNEQCTGDWIINLDADEFLPLDTMELLPYIIDANPEIEAYWLPRINTVDGLTNQHVQKWLWRISSHESHVHVCPTDSLVNSGEYKLLELYNLIINSENGFTTYKKPIVNWPDPQMRLYKKLPSIKWTKPVHEQLVGYSKFSNLPWEHSLAIRHYKNITRQEKQNNYYHNYTT